MKPLRASKSFTLNILLEDIQKSKLIFYDFTKFVEVIGKATYMLSAQFREVHQDVNWRQIEKMRHVLVHGYYTIDPESLWDTVEVDIPELKPWIVKYLTEMG